jgi:hypothetical protein
MTKSAYLEPCTIEPFKTRCNEVFTQIDNFLTAVSMQANTSPPDEVQLTSALKTAYVIYPSVQAAKTILYRLEGKVNINGKSINADFYQMNLAKPKATTVDENLLQDWICDKVEAVD